MRNSTENRNSAKRTPRNPIKVMIVEDSSTIRKFLQKIIMRDPQFQVVSSVGSGEEAIDALDTISPDVISLDIRLPGMNGFDVTRTVMRTRPTPIVVCSASVESADLHITMNALRAGALAVVEKPVGSTHQDYELLAHRLCSQLAVMSQVRVIRQWPGDRSVVNRTHRDDRRAIAPPPFDRRMISMVGIVASTGGPSAVTAILGSLPSDFPIPIVLVQHITASFAEGFMDWLGTMCGLKIVKGAIGVVPEPGHVYVAPSHAHLLVDTMCLQTRTGLPKGAHCPSGDALLESMAKSLGSKALGIVLTGMGEDGAQGLLAIKNAGGYSIAEDRSTAVVFGMPGAAERLGAVCELLPIHAIGPRLVQCARAQEVLCK